MAQNKGGKIFAVVNRKGGVAKTTTAIQLAHGLALKLLQPIDSEKEGEGGQITEINGQTYQVNGHVLLVDLDPQGNCATSLGVPTNGADVGDLLTGKQTLNKTVISADRSEDGFARPNLWLLPATTRLAEAKQELILSNFMTMMNARRSADAVPLLEVLQERLGRAVDRFSYVIIDCPPTLDALSNAVYHFADAAVVPVKLDYLSAAGAAQHVSDIRQAQTEGIDINIHTIVPTFYVPRQVLDQNILDALKKSYGNRRVAEPIPKSQAVAEAPAFRGGATLFEYAPQSSATQAYERLVERIHSSNGR